MLYVAVYLQCVTRVAEFSRMCFLLVMGLQWMETCLLGTVAGLHLAEQWLLGAAVNGMCVMQRYSNVMPAM